MYNIEDIDLTTRRQKLNSPRSIEACRRLGIIPKELYYIDRIQFKSENPSIISLPKEAQLLRWEHLEDTRLSHIDMIKNERDKIISDQIKDYSKDDGKKVKKIIFILSILLFFLIIRREANQSIFLARLRK